jgi:hypothetical protein
MKGDTMSRVRFALICLALGALALGLPGSEDKKPASATKSSNPAISPQVHNVKANVVAETKVLCEPKCREPVEKTKATPAVGTVGRTTVDLASVTASKKAEIKEIAPPPSELRSAEVRLVRVLDHENVTAATSMAATTVSPSDSIQLVPNSTNDREPNDFVHATAAPAFAKSAVGGQPAVDIAPAPVPVAEPSSAQPTTSVVAPAEASPAVAGNPETVQEGWTLPQPAWLSEHGFRLGGWADQGVSVVANRPADRYNGVVTFNDRDGEYQLNQLYFFLERATNTECGGWDLGGRVDFLYGTDGRFAQSSDGLEASWDQTARFYQAALPQAYVDVAWNDWSLRMGHFYTLLGYEVVGAPNNFFYSHSYTFQYGEPFTHTGALLTRQVGERLKVTAGLHRGNDQFDDTDGLNAVDFLGGVTWTNEAQNFSTAFAITAGEQGPGVSQTIYSLVGTWKATDRLRYVIQHDYGRTDTDWASPLEGDWYGLNQYFLYDISECWAAGLRYEWFRDEDGTRVRGLGDGNLNQGPFAGDFFEITAGLNWHPNANLTIRPELRYDWYNARVTGGPLPYDAGDRDNQFLFGCDLILTY